MTFPDLFERFSLAILPLGASDATHLRFQSVARYASARAGDAPFASDRSDQIVFVASGSTKLVACASQAREQVVAFHFAGDLVSVPARGAHAYSLCALEDCELIYFPADEFFRLARFESELVDAMLARAMRALSRCREKTIALGRKNAQERLAGFLLSMAERIGEHDEKRCLLDLPMSRGDIADSLGVTIETVSRQFGDLKAAELLETEGRSKVVLFDLAALNARAGHLSQEGASVPDTQSIRKTRVGSHGEKKSLRKAPA
ncbi:MAG: Crp/Fnr family transcriptional regulator [Erythrobacter sp.]